MNLADYKPADWLRVSVDVEEELEASGISLKLHLIDKLRNADIAWINAFKSALRFESGFESSWIHGLGGHSPYLSLELFAFVPQDMRATWISELILDLNPLIPFDFKAECLELLAKSEGGLHSFQLRAREVLTDLPIPRVRSLEKQVFSVGDGIDHLFEVPLDWDSRLKLVSDVSVHYSKLNIRSLLARSLVRESNSSTKRGYFSSEAEARIEADLAQPFLMGCDFLVDWAGEVSCQNGTWTLAEILRVVMLAPEFSLPDERVRRTLLGFYRSALKLSGRSIIGLGAGVFHVEHGLLCEPSYFYIGRDAVVGKGVRIDTVGGFLMESGSFVGGGFSPILIHTHKHIRAKEVNASQERKKILPCIFLATRGSRLPMSHVGIFETADFLGTDSPYAGIKGIPIEVGYA